MWRLLNGRLGPGETARVFPLSNWTEKDVWRYIARERLDVVPLYFAAVRPTIERNGTLLVRDDDRMPLRPGESLRPRMVRFRTLGCWPLTAAIESNAADLHSVIAETLAASVSPSARGGSSITTRRAPWSARNRRATSDGRACRSLCPGGTAASSAAPRAGRCDSVRLVIGVLASFGR
jgi:3'-phosphoadenosine 5'-phosphosulfate sulfotransferase (PAPS reductase)/FAD synthetase